MESTNKKNYFFLAIILVITILAITIPLLKINLDSRKQAKVGSADIDSLSQIKVATNSRNAMMGSFSSKENRYFINYDANAWEENTVPETVFSEDIDTSYFVTTDKRDFATIYISSANLSPKFVELFSLNQLAVKNEDTVLDNKIGTKPVFNPDVSKNSTLKDNLLKLAGFLEKDFDLTSKNKYSKISYVGSDVVEINNTLAIKFEFSEELFGQTSSYFEYVIPNGDYYLEIETKAVNKHASEALVQKFIKGISFERNLAAVLGDMDAAKYDESQSTALVKPSVVSIVHTYCDEIKGSENSIYLKTYTICSGTKGSGFFVGDNYIATNGHVVANYSEETIIGSILTFNPQITIFLEDYIKEVILREAGIRLTTNQAQQVGLIVFKSPASTSSFIKDLYKSMEKKEFSINRKIDNHYVGFGEKAFELQEDALTEDNVEDYVETNKSIVKVSLVDYDLGNFYSKETFIDGDKPKGSDVALLSIDDSNDLVLPSLALSSSQVREGDSILVIGFPGLVSGSQGTSLLLSYDLSSTQSTISKGIISSIKQDNEGRDLFQTDASIDHGNSGGPAFNEESEVIGVATYGIESRIGNFNFLRDVEDLRQLADSNSINIDETTNTTYAEWQQGLEYFWASRYTKAIAEFDKVKKDYPMHPDVDSYIEEAEEEIEKGNDIDLLFGIQKVYLFGAGAGIFVLLTVLIVVLLILFKKKKGGKTDGPQQETNDTKVADVVKEEVEVKPSVELIKNRK